MGKSIFEKYDQIKSGDIQDSDLEDLLLGSGVHGETKPFDDEQLNLLLIDDDAAIVLNYIRSAPEVPANFAFWKVDRREKFGDVKMQVVSWLESAEIRFDAIYIDAHLGTSKMGRDSILLVTFRVRSEDTSTLRSQS